jgi:iron complex transport system substrate-binding protein
MQQAKNFVMAMVAAMARRRRGVAQRRATLRLALMPIVLITLGTLPCWASRVLVDELGRKVTVPDHPHRILCLTPSITDAVFALGAADDVIAVTDYVEFPAEARKKPSVGSISTPSMEMVIALHPDLLLAVPQFTQQSVLDRFQRMGLPVYMVEPHGVAGILHSIGSLGQATGREAQASVLIARLQQRIDAVRLQVRGKPVVSVFLPVSYDPVITIGKGAFIADMIDIAGGRSITDDLNQEWGHISMEAVIARAPEALLMMREGSVTPAILKTRPGWNSLAAVRSGRVYFIDRRMDLPSPVAIDALEDLARQFHP